MNFIDYLFSDSPSREGEFILGREEKLSYPQLRAGMLAVSRTLQESGTVGQPISIVAENSVFFITAYLGVMHSGNIAVPLPPTMQSVSFSEVYRACKPPYEFVQKKFSGDVVFDAVRFTDLPPAGGIDSAYEPAVIREDNDVACIIFTSGSTGKPKGVMLSHRNLAANTESILQALPIAADDASHVVLPFSYCFGASVLHTHIRAGARLVLNNTFMLTSTVLDDWENFGCTSFYGVPAHYQLLLRASHLNERAFPRMKYFAQAGGKLANPYIEEIQACHPEIPFFVMYGQTEATARLSVLAPNLLAQKIGSIGKGIPGVTLQVVGEDGKTVAPGVVGEVVAQGENIMLGYYLDPQETGKAIVAGRLHTGDIGLTDEDGFIYLVSRSKHIIKSGGTRVSPAEIEGVIARLPEVIACVVIGVPDELLGEVPRAYVIPRSEEAISKEAIINFCRKHLPTAAVPKDIVFRTALPLTPSGKIDRTLLSV